jgi:pyruvate dehydrogenase (quinone)
MCTDPAQARHLIDRAMRIAKAGRTVTCVIVPNDVQGAEAVPTPPREHGTVHSGTGYSEARLVPERADLERAAAVLNEGKRVAMLVGAGALHASEEVTQVAELLGAGVAKALLGKAALPDDLPFVTGSIGLLGTKPSSDMMTGCDTLLVVGSSFPYSEFLPAEGQARGVQIDHDGRMLGLRYPMEVNLVGDSREALRELVGLLERKQDRSWREEIEAEVERWWKVLAEQAGIAAEPLNPLLVFHELSPRLPDSCILTADSGSATNWWARHLKLREGMRTALSGTLATMCPGVPYAFAAKMAYPERPVIAALGDGAMQMLGINALIDVAAHWERWSNKQLVVLVLHNDDLNQVTWEQRVLAGDPKLEASQRIPDFPYAAYAKSLGLGGIRLDDPAEVGAAWDEALGAGRPVLLEAITDPEVPPLPPHIKLEQATSLAKSLLRGDPHGGRVLSQSLKGKLKELTTR